MSHKINLTLPVRCEHYEFKLVEELVLAAHPVSAHFGKICVIGYHGINEATGEHSLYSLSYLEGGGKSETSLDLPDHTLSMPLQFQPEVFETQIPNNSKRHVKTSGELYYRSKLTQELSQPRDFIVQLQKEQHKLEKLHNLLKMQLSDMDDPKMHPLIKEELVKLINLIKTKYEPLIVVHWIDNLTEENARNLIFANLKNLV
uniref:CSON005542 protein n=1 Tax=Culicoides sonorensis TaxID=179676 RepID=A0A336MUT6_CULSO